MYRALLELGGGEGFLWAGQSVVSVISSSLSVGPRPGRHASRKAESNKHISAKCAGMYKKKKRDLQGLTPPK